MEVFDCPSGTTQWRGSDGQTRTSSSADARCIIIKDFEAYGYKPVNRYNYSGLCMSILNVASTNTMVMNLGTFYYSAKALYTLQRNTLSQASGSKYEADAMLTKFSNKIADYNTLNTDFSTYYTFINSFQNTTTALKSCKFFRDDMLIFSNTVCFKTVSAFVDQTVWIACMGPFMCLMSICMFAAIRCPFRKSQPKGEAYYEPPQEGQGTEFKNIDYPVK